MAKGPKGKNSKQWYNPDSLVMNIVVSVICLLGIGGSLWLFRTDLNDTLRRLAEEPVGTVVWKERTVQRRASGRVLWEQLERSSSLYDGDFITANDFSGARIEFINGENLELLPGTSTQIFYRHEDISRIELIEGALSLLTGRFTVTVSKGAERVNLNPRTLASVEARKGIRLNLFQGSGSLTASGETRRAEAGESLETGEDGTFLGSPGVMVVSPRNGTRIIRAVGGAEEVEFIWRRVNAPEDSKVVLELAEDREFTRRLGSWTGTGASAVFELFPGTFYWKAYDLSAPESADQGRLEIAVSPGFQALSPASGSVYRYTSKLPELRFSWSAPEEVSELVLEAADNPGMRQPVFRQQIKSSSGSGGSFAYSGLAEGDWYWRVSPVYPEGVEGKDLPSQVNAFTIVRESELAVPVLSFPASGSVVYTGSGTGNIYFSWKPLEEAVSYSVFVCRDRELSETLISASTTRNYYAYDPGTGILGEGDYYWGVYQTAGNEQRSGISTPVPFSVRNGDTALRIIYPPDNHSVTADRSPDLSYRWKNLSFPVKFQISERPDFSPPLIRDDAVNGSAAHGSFLNPGVYYWRIAAETSAGSFDSSPRRLVVSPSLEAPKVLAPGNGEVLKIEEGKAVTFSWERMNYADYYQFSLFVDGRDAPLTEILSLSSSQVMVYFDSRTAGKFRWTVQGFSDPTLETLGRSGLIASSRFTVSPPASVVLAGGEEATWTVPRISNVQSFSGQIRSPVTLQYPESGASIDGISALRAPPEAKWSASEPLKNIQLVISRNENPISDPRAIILEMGSQASSITFPSLTEGVWYWTIQGDTADGRGVSSGDPFFFSVLAIPPLPPPRRFQPENEAVLTLAQLTRDRSITFNWETIEGANAYIFSLFGDGDPPKPLITGPADPETSYVLEDLTLLDQDSYLWQVEAVYRNQNGVIEQRGIIEQHPFVIDVARSNTLQTHSQGPMYGQ
ncbi:MAG: hypothetical protein LBS48_06435 [Treponema sp.]|jgi:hypothetical protein|nr:hypothetical protein [Treponema sp.]